ncbi:alpha/beta fold hydrolase [Gordonia sp. SID5947]|uniref:esterase/lipase family protein n=1 Tax=Gordonia sp. SID5947 TaxID=2690315 RepID=UPI001368DAA4|nr:alpha/beta fold hydrolase [Gordonia sp. SID5947]MYR05880.1 alpha/beta fold hydrolase [Gordonia sp. SID5947]
MSIRSVVVLVSGVLAMILSVVAAPSADAAPTTTRVLIIPGQYVGAVPFAPMADDLTSRGYPTAVLDLPGFDIKTDARKIGAAVGRIHREHPADRIALVGHSIGGISARYYLKEMGGHAKVATYVAVGSPQYGSPGACGQDAAPEVCPGTSFMTSLNKGDDTPGKTQYYGVRSAREWVDGHLDGGQCRVTPIPANESLPALGLEHTFEPLDPKIWDVTAAAIGGQCRGRFVTQPDGVLSYRTSALPGAPVR